MKTKHFILIVILLFLSVLISGCVQKLSSEPVVEPMSPEESEAIQLSDKEKEAVATFGLRYEEVSSEEINIFVDLDPVQENISALQFDLNFDSSVLDFKNVEISQTAKQSEKILDFNKMEADVVRVLIFSLNQNILSKGSVAKFTFNLLDVSKSIQEANLVLKDVVASSPQAESVSLNILGFDVKFTESPTSQPVEEDMCSNFNADDCSSNKNCYVSWGGPSYCSGVPPNVICTTDVEFQGCKKIGKAVVR